MDFTQFNMIDNVVKLEAEQPQPFIHAQSHVPETSFIFDAHFPGFPVLPGVVMIETIAQAAGMYIVSAYHGDKIAFLYGVEKTRFRDFVSPGALLDIHIRVLQTGSAYFVSDGDIFCEGKKVASAQVRLTIADVPDIQIKQLLLKRAKEINIPMQTYDTTT